MKQCKILPGKRHRVINNYNGVLGIIQTKARNTIVLEGIFENINADFIEFFSKNFKYNFITSTILWARESYNMSTSETAMAIGIDEERYIKWEKGEEFPSFGLRF